MSDFYNSVANESFVEGDLTIEGAVIADSFLRSDGTPISGGGISGPPVTTVGYIPIWDDLTGTSLGAGLDPNAIGSGDVTGPSSSVVDQIAIYDTITGKSISRSSGFTKQNVMSNTLHATNNIPAWSAVGNNVMSDSGISVADINNKVQSSGSLFSDGVVPVYADNTGQVIKGAALLSTFVKTIDQVNFSNNTQSTTKDDGAIVLTSGGLGVEGNINNGGDLGVGGDAVITGSLTVNGSIIDPTANGDVSGPGIAVTNNNIAIWDGITGTGIKESATNPVTIDTNGQLIVENPQNISNLAPGNGGLIVRGGAVVQGDLRVDGNKINNILISSIDTKAIAPSTNTDNFLTAWDGTNSKTLKNGINSDLVLLSNVAQQNLINPDIRYITPGTTIPQFVESAPVVVDPNATSVVCISGDSLWMAIAVGVNQIWIYSRTDIYTPFVKFGDVTLSLGVNEIYHLVMDFDGSEIMAATGFGTNTRQFFFQRGAALSPYTEIANLQIDSTYIDPPYMTDDGVNVFLLDAPGSVAEKVHVLSRSGSTWTSLGVLNPNATGIGPLNRSFATNGSGSVLAWETNNVIEVWLKTGSAGLIGDWTYSTDLPASNGAYLVQSVNTAGDRILATRGGVPGTGPRNWVFNSGTNLWVQTVNQPGGAFLKFSNNTVTPDGLLICNNTDFDVVLSSTNDWTGVSKSCDYTRGYNTVGANQITNNTLILVPNPSIGAFVAVTIQTSPLVIQGNSKGLIVKGSSEIIGDFDVSGKILASGGIDKLASLSGVVTVNTSDPSTGKVLQAISATAAEWVTPAGGGGGDVSGPSSSTDKAVAVYDGLTGKLIKETPVTIDVVGNLVGVANLSANTMISVVAAGTDMTVGSLNNKLRLTANGGDIDVIANTNNINLNSVKTIVQTDLDVGTTGVNINGTSGKATLPGGVDKLSTLTTAVDVSVSAAPSAGQVLTAGAGGTTATWVTPAGGGGGDVTGPASSVNNNIVVWNGTSGDLVQDGGVSLANLVKKSDTTQTITATTGNATFQSVGGDTLINAFGGDTVIVGNKVVVNPILEIGTTLPVIISATTKKITGATGGIDTLTSLSGAVTVNTTNPVTGQVLQTTSTTEAQWVTLPAVIPSVTNVTSGTTDAIALYTDATGQIIKDSLVTIDASGNVSGGTYNETTLLTETVGFSSDLSINSTRGPTYTGSKNTLIGAKTVLTSGAGNLIVAASSGLPSFFDHSISSGSDNVFLGQMAGHEVTTGDENVFVGKLAGAAYTVSSGNTCIGNAAGTSATGANCVYIGDLCGGGSTQAGTRNTFIGKQAGTSFTTGSRNTLIGYNNDTLDGTGTGQTVIGDEAIGGGANSIAIGASANGTLPNQCMIGNPALTEIVPNAAATCDLGSVTNPFENLTLSGGATITGAVVGGTVVGGTINGMTMETFGTSTIMNTVRPAALTGADNTIINAGTVTNATSTARENVIIGTNFNLGITTSQGNVFIGLAAGESTTTGSSSVYIGRLAGQGTTSGGSNVSIGPESGMNGFSLNNTTIGTRAGKAGSVTAGILRSVFIGTDTGSDSTSQGQTCIGNKSKTNGISSIAIGYEAVGTASNQCMIGGQFMSEIVPSSLATCNLGSATNPFDNLTLNNASNNAVTTINGVIQDTKRDAYGFLSQISTLDATTLAITPVSYTIAAANPSWVTVPVLNTSDSDSFNTTIGGADRTITISDAGAYVVDYSASNTTDDPSRNFYYAIAVNGVVQITNTATVQRKQTNNRFETVSKSSILTLAANDVITLKVACTDAATATASERTLFFFSYGLSCHRLSDSN